MPGSRALGFVVLLAVALLAVPSKQELSGQVRRDRQISGGLGYSFSTGDQDVFGVGGSLAYERVVVGTSWLGARLYAGGVFSRTAASTCPAGIVPCAVSSQVGVAGAKLRLMAPIPYIGPFIEVGAGVSAGSIRTRIGAYGPFDAVDEGHSGLMLNIPFGVGLAFGRHHQHKVSFDYFTYPGRDHVAGSVAIGIGL